MSALGAGVGEEELLAIDLVVGDRGLSLRTREPVDEGLPIFGFHIGVLRRIDEDYAILVERVCPLPSTKTLKSFLLANASQVPRSVRA